MSPPYRPADADTPASRCLRCGYDLRGLTESRNCPECGLALSISRSPDQWLRLSNPQWTARLLSGTHILILAQLVALAALLIITVVTDNFLRWSVNDPQVRAVCIFAAGVYYLLFHAGMLMHTATEGRAVDPMRPLRWAMRAGAAMGLLGSAVALFDSINSISVDPAALDRLHLSGFLLRAILVLNTLLAWSFYRRLALRLPSHALAVATSALLAALLVWAAALALDIWTWGIITVWAFWLYLPVSLVLLLLFARALAAASHSAQIAWAVAQADEPKPSSA